MNKLEKFNPSDVEDVKILVQIKGKTYTITPKGGSDEYKEWARQCRVGVLDKIFAFHALVDVPLQDLDPSKVLKRMKQDKVKRIGAYQDVSSKYEKLINRFIRFEARESSRDGEQKTYDRLQSDCASFFKSHPGWISINWFGNQIIIDRNGIYSLK